MAFNKNIVSLAKAFKYPLQPDVKGAVDKVDGTDCIDQSIYSILSTPIGSAFYQEDRGSQLYSLVYEPNDEILRSLLDTHIAEALEKWESRITLTDIVYDYSDYTVNCMITYVIKSTGLENSYIYPFNREIDR